MKCSEVQSLFSLYLDSALTGVQMQQVAAHAEACDSCQAEYQQLRATQRMVAGLGRRQAPPDLALQLRIALSVERTKNYRRRWEGMLVRWENAFNAFMFPATAGLLSAVIFFGLIIGFFGLPVNSSASSDVPLALYTPPQLNPSALPFLTTIGNSEGSLVVETYVDANGRVEDYRIISAPEGTQDLIPRVDNLLIFTTFRPAMNMGRPTPSRVVLSFSGMNVKG
jgi:Putative zinc-finger